MHLNKKNLLVFTPILCLGIVIGGYFSFYDNLQNEHKSIRKPQSINPHKTRTRLEYNQNGEVLSECHYYSDGTKDCSSHREKNVIKYGQNNEIVSECTYYSNGNEKCLTDVELEQKRLSLSLLSKTILSPPCVTILNKEHKLEKQCWSSPNNIDGQKAREKTVVEYDRNGKFSICDFFKDGTKKCTSPYELTI